MAAFRSCVALPHLQVMLRKASHSSLVAASSLGKCPRVLMILRSCALMLSMAFVQQPGSPRTGMRDHADLCPMLPATIRKV